MFQPQKENMTANTSTHLDSKGRPHIQVSNNAVQSAPLVPTSYSCVHFAQLAPQTKEIHVLLTLWSTPQTRRRSLFCGQHSRFFCRKSVRKKRGGGGGGGGAPRIYVMLHFCFGKNLQLN